MEDNSLGELSLTPPIWHPLNDESFDGGKRHGTYTAEDYYLFFSNYVEAGRSKAFHPRLQSYQVCVVL